jgi:hypothetical protein
MPESFLLPPLRQPLQTAPPVLTDLIYRKPGWRRWLHGLPELSLRNLHRILLRVPHWRGRIFRLAGQRLNEIVTCTMKDAALSLLKSHDSILYMEHGKCMPSGPRRAVALYVHFSAAGTVSDMVLRQLADYDRLGFDIVFISNAQATPDSSWDRVHEIAALVVRRRNVGLDFGAWKDLLPLVLQNWPQAAEILLVNDSCLGPLRPLDPAFTAIRAAGNGIFGMQESQQGGTHLQSWFILARGAAAITDLAAFFARLKLSTSKWKTIQRGELRLAREMLKRGHRVRAVHGYAALLSTALADPAQRADLHTMLPDSNPAARPLNPTHHLWRSLLASPYCSFIKTELVQKNPGKVPNVERLWKSLVPANAPCGLDVLESHLAACQTVKPAYRGPSWWRAN